MFKKALVTLVLIAAMFSGCSNELGIVKPPGPPMVKKPWKYISPAVKQLVHQTAYIQVQRSGNDTQGSAVIIDEYHILTASHMVRDMKSMLIYTMDNRQFQAVDLYDWPYADLCIVKVDKPITCPSIRIANVTPSVGQAITVCGSPTGGTFYNSVSFGNITGLNRRWDEIPGILFYQTDAFITGGNSGGPWINSAGELISITSWGAYGSGNLSCGVPLELIKQIIQDYNGSVKIK